MKAYDIPAIEYVGYYWMSDRTEPVVIGDKAGRSTEALPDEFKECLGDPSANPFVVEAQLFSPERRLSFGIKYVDGTYVVSEYKDVPADVSSTALGDSVTLKRYVANRMGKRKLRFLQYWEERKDPLCEGMGVLQPAAQVFIGFESTTANSNDKGTI